MFPSCTHEYIVSPLMQVDVEKWLKSTPRGFDYRGGADTVTKGIWIWSKPFIIKLQDKKVRICCMVHINGCMQVHIVHY